MKIKRNGILTVLGGAAMVIGLSACFGGGGAGTANTKEHAAQAQDSANLINNQPPPVYDHSEIRGALIDIQDLQANGKQTTAFFFQYGMPDPVFVCAAVGQPIPVTAQLTNPDQNYNSGYPQGGTSYPIAQMDPNGIYTPPDALGTNVVCIDPATGVKYVHYSEGNVEDVAGPAKWDSKTHQIVLTGTPVSITHSTKK